MVSFDVNSIIQRMEDRLKTKLSWQSLLFYSTNKVLIETFAEELHYLADFDVYLTNESKWGLARNRSSLLSSQDIHNYQAKRKRSSVGSLRVSSDKDFNNFANNDIFIPKYSIFKAGDVKFLSREGNLLSRGSKYIDIDIMQGELKTDEFLAQGIAKEIYNIDNDSIENSSIEVRVNDGLWTEVPSLYNVNGTQTVYELRQRYDNNTVDVLFGDDVYGRKLKESDLVAITYIETKGEDGNIGGVGEIDKVVSNVRDVIGNSVKLFCTNLDIVIGGRDEEDIESIRSNATNYFKTGDRAVTREDYETLILQLNSSIDKVIVWGVYEYNLDNDRDMWDYLPAEENLVNICALNTELLPLNAFEKNELSLNLLPKKSVTDILRFYDPEIIDIMFYVNAYIKDKSFLSYNVKNDIEVALTGKYGLANNTFNTPAYFSDYIRLIDEVPGVEYHNTSMRIRNLFDFQSDYLCDFQLSLYPLTLGSLEVYIQDLNDDITYLIGKDNSLGNLVGEVGFDLTGSFINYANGIGQLIVISGLVKTINNYKIIITYKIENNNAIPKNRTQILSFNLAESNIVTSYIM